MSNNENSSEIKSSTINNDILTIVKSLPGNESHVTSDIIQHVINAANEVITNTLMAHELFSFASLLWSGINFSFIVGKVYIKSFKIHFRNVEN